MIWTSCLIISGAILVASVIGAVCVGKTKSLKSNRVITPFNILFAGEFLLTIAILYPLFGIVIGDESTPFIKQLLFTIRGAFQVFTIDADSSFISEIVTSDVCDIAGVYSICLSVLFVVAPLFTFGFIFSFFKNAISYVRLFFYRFRSDIYAFSELNEKSLDLASSIKRNHKKAKIVFADVGEKGENDDSLDLFDKANELGALCFKKDLVTIHFKPFGKNKLFFFTISENELDNIAASLKIIDRYKEIPNVKLYVFTTRIESEMLLSAVSNDNIEVHRVNEVLSIINNYLYSEGKELFERAYVRPDGEKEINAVVIGMGKHGTEMVKALSWYCQMDGYHLRIDAFDASPDAEDRFRAQCPELMSSKFNGKSIPGECEYTINIHSDVKTGTKEFEDIIETIPNITFAFVCLGSDEEDVKTAVELRVQLLRKNPVKKPEEQVRIIAVVYNSDEAKSIKCATNFKNQEYVIHCIGDRESSYSEKTIMSSEVEEAGLQVHLGYCQSEEDKPQAEKDFRRYEYNYLSSIACAIHLEAKVACGIKGVTQREEDITPEVRDSLQRLEHRRWNAYMRAQGYVFSGSLGKESRYDLAKKHHNLCPYDDLSESDKQKDLRVLIRPPKD